MYPFFKTIETFCDKLCGCKKQALKDNERRKAAKDKYMQGLADSREKENALLDEQRNNLKKKV